MDIAWAEKAVEHKADCDTYWTQGSWSNLQEPAKREPMKLKLKEDFESSRPQLN